MKHEFPLGTFDLKNRSNFSDVQLLPGIFHWNDKKRKLFVNGKQLLVQEQYCIRFGITLEDEN